MTPLHVTRRAAAEIFGTSLGGATFRLSIVYWTVVFLSSSVLWGFVGTDPFDSAMGKLVHYTLAALMTFGITAILFRLRALSLVWKAVLCFELALVAAPIYVLIDLAIYAICTYPTPIVFSWTDTAYNLVYGTSLFFGWSCLFMSLQYSFEVRDQERRLAAAREEALSAQMRALRYQVNPHFLFNTLNSMAGLIEEGATDKARDMVLSLSSFLRTTLELDPLQDVPLKDEIALQRGYLDIERNRFSDRMTVNISMAPDVSDALVPSLILQPLVENAVKHGVGRRPGDVEIRISASGDADNLSLVVENDMVHGHDASEAAVEGMGIGLKNVAERIAARFPGAASCVGSIVSPGRYRATLTMPLRLA